MTRITPAGSLKKRLLKGGAWVFLGKIVAAAAAVVVNAMLARILSPEELGAYFLILSFVIVASLFGQLGLSRAVVKLVAEALAHNQPGRARGIIRAVVGIGLIGAVIIFLLIWGGVGEWVASVVFTSDQMSGVTVLAALWVCVYVFQGLFSETFRGLHRVGLATLFGGLFSGLTSAILFACIWLVVGKTGLKEVIIVSLAAGMTSVVLAGFMVAKQSSSLGKAEPAKARDILFLAMPMLATSAALFGVREVHLWVLGAIRPESDVALYGVCAKLINFLTMPLLIINSVLPPVVAELNAKGKKSQLQTVLRSSSTLASIPSILGFLVVVFWGGSILSFVFGEFYEAAYMLFLILAAVSVVNVMSGSPGVLLMMSGYERVVMRYALIGGVLGIMASIFFINAIGVVGVGIGVGVGMIIHNVGMWNFSRKRLDIHTHAGWGSLIEIYRWVRERIESSFSLGSGWVMLELCMRTAENIVWRISGKQVIECFGDSHATVFRRLNYVEGVGDTRFRAVSVKGATAFGLGNPNSKTNTLDVFRDSLAKISRKRRVMFLMGEVDAGFVIWWRSQRYQKDPYECLDDAVTRYTVFLKEVLKRHNDMIICSAPLPTIEDGIVHGGVANARREITATQVERTEMTLEFNRRMASWARKHGAVFVDLDSYSYDEKTGKVKDTLLNKDVSDHHYDKDSYRDIIFVGLRELGVLQ